MGRSGLMLCVLAAACHQAGALRVAPPVTTRRALLSLAAATSLASTPAFAEQDKQAEQAAPAVVVRPPIKMASAEEQAELEKARSAIPVPEPPKGSDLERMLATAAQLECSTTQPPSHAEPEAENSRLWFENTGVTCMDRASQSHPNMIETCAREQLQFSHYFLFCFTL
eukprot:CAMPEP_0118814550 /NCGR_PEP_ID=MMETSP1162-20130426/3619_1 /TAXON_ID=33656 /ORGANISM="Phaeocystis Sp, Strain CCMP2710" /LENGTH=168 /DNA_ID=CAMNT_0006744445 /DNA_START=17 /DNA_END=524 /DNA_ORIENTATION=+